MLNQFQVGNDQSEFFTDCACGLNLGFSIYFQGHWAYACWPKVWKATFMM